MAGEGWRAARVSDSGTIDDLHRGSAGCPFGQDSGGAEVAGRLAVGPTLVAAIGQRDWLLKEEDRAEVEAPCHADCSWLVPEAEVEEDS